MFKKAITNVALLAVIVGIGYPPPIAQSRTQGVALARVAAYRSVFKQTGGAPFRVLSESYADGCYVVRAEENTL